MLIFNRNFDSSGISGISSINYGTGASIQSTIFTNQETEQISKSNVNYSRIITNIKDTFKSIRNCGNTKYNEKILKCSNCKHFFFSQAVVKSSKFRKNLLNFVRFLLMPTYLWCIWIVLDYESPSISGPIRSIKMYS